MAYPCGTSRRSDAGAGGLPPQPDGLGGVASPRFVARRSRTAVGTPHSSRLARLAIAPSAAAGGCETNSGAITTVLCSANSDARVTNLRASLCYNDPTTWLSRQWRGSIEGTTHPR